MSNGHKQHKIVNSNLFSKLHCIIRSNRRSQTSAKAADSAKFVEYIALVPQW